MYMYKCVYVHIYICIYIYIYICLNILYIDISASTITLHKGGVLSIINPLRLGASKRKAILCRGRSLSSAASSVLGGIPEAVVALLGSLSIGPPTALWRGLPQKQKLIALFGVTSFGVSLKGKPEENKQTNTYTHL